MYIWLDVETTGLDTETCETLEIASIMTDNFLRELGRFHVVCRSTPDTWENAENVVSAMHTASGLRSASLNSQVDETEGWQRFKMWVNQLMPVDEELVIAGSGISHFDVFLFDRWVGPLNPPRAYWTLDVGSARRLLRIGGIFAPDYISKMNTRAHRAMVDIEAHLAEARWFVQISEEVEDEDG